MTCSICLEDINIIKEDIVKLNCNHIFHLDCISKVENNSCPLCRGDILNGCPGNHNVKTFFNTSQVKKKNGLRYCTICSKQKVSLDSLIYLN
jgi:hypothetical protein